MCERCFDQCLAQEEAEIRKEFQRFDLDKNGYITKGRYLSLLWQVNIVMCRGDVGGDQHQRQLRAGQGGGGRQVHRRAGRGQGRPGDQSQLAIWSRDPVITSYWPGLLPGVPSRLEVQGVRPVRRIKKYEVTGLPLMANFLHNLCIFNDI